MNKLKEIIEANNLLMSLGGEDQLQNISTTAIERSLELQHRIDLALEYAKTSTSNSTHAKNMAAILLDGVIPMANEAIISPAPEEVKVVEAPQKKSHHKKAPQKKVVPQRRNGLASRPRAERQAFRQWADEQGFTVPKAGPVPMNLLDAYDQTIKELSRMRENPPTTESESA
jgi:hypothetical protein